MAQLPAGTLFAGVDPSLDSLVTVVLNGSGQRLDPGLFWYHPHIREDYTQEQSLYGNILVVAADPLYWSPVNPEITLVVDDILLDTSNPGIWMAHCHIAEHLEGGMMFSFLVK